MTQNWINRLDGIAESLVSDIPGASWTAQGDPEFDWLQRRRRAAPAAIAGFLKRERLFDSEPVRDLHAFPASRRRFRLPRSEVPAGAGAGRGDRAACGKGREHLHLDFGGDKRLLRRGFCIDLDDAANSYEITAGIG